MHPKGLLLDEPRRKRRGLSWGGLSIFLLLVFALYGAYALGYKDGVQDLYNSIFQPQIQPSKGESNEQSIRTFRDERTT